MPNLRPVKIDNGFMRLLARFTLVIRVIKLDSTISTTAAASLFALFSVPVLAAPQPVSFRSEDLLSGSQASDQSKSADSPVAGKIDASDETNSTSANLSTATTVGRPLENPFGLILHPPSTLEEQRHQLHCDVLRHLKVPITYRRLDSYMRPAFILPATKSDGTDK